MSKYDMRVLLAKIKNLEVENAELKARLKEAQGE